jgi:hypothetical protein
MYDSLNSAIYNLRKRGFRLNFFHDKLNFIASSDLGIKIPFQDFKIVETYLFPSLREDGSQSILYAIRTKSGLSGILFDYKDHFQEQLKFYLKQSFQPELNEEQNLQYQY